MTPENALFQYLLNVLLVERNCLGSQYDGSIRMMKDGVCSPNDSGLPGV